MCLPPGAFRWAAGYFVSSRDECVAELRRFDVDIQAGMRCTDRIHQNNVRLKFPLCSAPASASRLFLNAYIWAWTFSTCGRSDCISKKLHFHTVYYTVSGGKCAGNKGGIEQAMFIIPIVAELFLVRGRAVGFNATYTQSTFLFRFIPVLLARKMRKMKVQACVSVCVWVCVNGFGMGGGNSLHASIFFFVNGGVRVVEAVKATSKQHITA